MATIPLRQREKPAPKRVLAIGESRRSSPPSCFTCGSRRKTRLGSLGWVCTTCFDHYKETAEQGIEVGSGVARLRQAYARAVLSYHAAHPTSSPRG